MKQTIQLLFQQTAIHIYNNLAPLFDCSFVINLSQQLLYIRSINISMSKKSIPPQSNKALPPKSSVNPKSPLTPDYVSESVSIEQVRQCKVAFDIFDHDQSGLVDPIELKNAFVSLGFADTNKLIFRIINDLDVQHEGGLNFANFLKLQSHKLEQNLSLGEVERVFKAFDQEGAGKIDAQQFRQVADELGENLTEQEIEKIFFKTDFDQDGYITPEDFYEVLISRSGY